MNLEQMEYVTAVAAEGSFTAAAQSCHVSLSAISQSVSQLEAELGVALFTRGRGAGAVPTAEGMQLIRKAEEVLDKVAELREQALHTAGTVGGKLRIATIPGPMHLLVDSIRTFKQEYPEVKIEIREMSSGEILEEAESGRIDFGLMVETDEVRERRGQFLFRSLLKGKRVVGVPRRSPSARLRAIRPEQLAGRTLVLYDDPDLKAELQALLAACGGAEILFTTNNTKAIQDAVGRGLAWTVGIDYSFTDKNAGIVPVELAAEGMAPLDYGWLLYRGRRPTEAAKRFLRELQTGFAAR
ncbi:LysR family transcriptional regulator [Gorillibacterium sp. sgz500922]|uniref:LysR family transcriptional regulator n=1 Tax=Gorillibacterium sp. sgz500922 TaxID=3446694 RepID=UPI003F68057E